MEFSAVLGFAVIAATLIAVPGPDWAYILAAGARDRVIWPAVAGLMTGYLLITIVVVIGVGPVVASVPLAMTVLTIAGAGFLIYLGIRTVGSKARIEQINAHGALASGPGGYIVRGIAVSGLNPKGLLIFLSILPQFAQTPSSWLLPVQFAVLGAVFVLITGVFYLLLGHTAHRVLGARPRLAEITTRIAGAAMILLGTVLLIERTIETIDLALA